MIYEPIPERRCKQCKAWYPLTAEHFQPVKVGKAGLSRQCRTCRVSNTARWRGGNRGHISDYNHQYVVDKRRDPVKKKASDRALSTEQRCNGKRHAKGLETEEPQ